MNPGELGLKLTFMKRITYIVHCAALCTQLAENGNGNIRSVCAMNVIQRFQKPYFKAHHTIIFLENTQKLGVLLKTSIFKHFLL